MRGIPEDKALFIIEDLHAFGTADGAKRLRDAIVDLKEPLRPMSEAPKNGRQFLVKFQNERRVWYCTFSYNLYVNKFIHDTEDSLNIDDAEGWYPLPGVTYD